MLELQDSDARALFSCGNRRHHRGGRRSARGGGLADADRRPIHSTSWRSSIALPVATDHFHEGETAFAAGFTVERQAVLDLATAEQIEQVLLFRLEREIADVDGRERELDALSRKPFRAMGNEPMGRICAL